MSPRTQIATTVTALPFAHVVGFAHLIAHLLRANQMADPWDDWIPGVLNQDQMAELCRLDLINLNTAYDASFLDASSMDLHLTEEAYHMTKGSVKPTGDASYSYFLKQPHLAEKHSPDANGSFRLDAHQTYVFRLRERLGKPLARLGIHGQATAKSSVGRVDVLARLIVDGMDTYECFSPRCFDNGCGDMYLEITPITFSVLVRSETSLSQLRFFYGTPANVEVQGPELYRSVYRGIEKIDGSLTVDISNADINGVPAAAFYAEPTKDGFPPIPLWTATGEKRGSAAPCDYWKLKPADENDRVQVQSEKFYILRSKERISVPPGIAIYCRASDETIGEMRIHYAGFVHPHFGRCRTDGRQGTPLIFEVRGHQVNVSLADGERMANLTFYRMSMDAPPPRPSPYEDQNLELSKFFHAWPPKLRIRKGADDGSVEEDKD
jgi:dCTP deaminase